MNKTLIALAVSSLASWNAVAVITTVSPFTGDYSETFESFTVQAVSGAGATALDQAPIIGGLAKLQAANESGIYQNSGTTFSLGGSLAQVGTVNGGDRAFGSQNGTPGTVFFVEPVFKFGGYFGGYNGGAGSPKSTISATFYDFDSNFLETKTWNYNNLTGALEWQGWEVTSGAGFGTIIFTDTDPTFQFDQFAMDDLQVVVPEMENWIVGCLLGGVVAFKGLREYRNRKLAVTVVA